MQAQALLYLSALAAIMAVAMLRYSWSRRGRSALFNLIGWGLLLAAAVSGAWAGGAWGMAVASLLAMAAAAIVLAIAAAGSPAKEGRSSLRRVNMLPEAGEPRRIGPRLLTFVLTVPLAFLSSIAFAIGLRGAFMLAGWTQANANALALFAVPLAWGILTCIILMCEGRKSQLAALFLPAAAISIAFVPGA